MTLLMVMQKVYVSTDFLSPQVMNNLAYLECLGIMSKLYRFIDPHQPWVMSFSCTSIQVAIIKYFANVGEEKYITKLLGKIQ